MKIEIFGINNRTSRKKYRTFARSVLNKLYSKKESCDKRILNIIIVSDNYIKKLNRQFLGQNRPTDVLAFPVNDMPSTKKTVQSIKCTRHSALALVRGEVWAEIYISRDRATFQAKHLKITRSKEICNLIKHGILHLLGYSHGEMKR